jgi:hypothetical protein
LPLLGSSASTLAAHLLSPGKPERAWLWRAFGAQQGGAGAAGLVAATLRAR